MNKKRITYILMATLTVLVLYISYFKIYGVSKSILIKNEYVCFSDDCTFKTVDFTVLVNGDTVFSDAVESHPSPILGKFAEVTFHFGWNRIEVLSDSTNLYAGKNVYLLFPKNYQITFAKSIYGNYHGMHIYDYQGIN